MYSLLGLNPYVSNEVKKKHKTIIGTREYVELVYKLQWVIIPINYVKLSCHKCTSYHLLLTENTLNKSRTMSVVDTYQY